MGGLLRFPNINQITISGRITRDVELKYSSNNLPIARICIAVSHYFKDEYGNQKEEASFIDTVAFGRTAQICQECLKKGSPVLIEGALKSRTYTDQNNQNKKITEIIVNRVYPLEREEGYQPNPNYQGQQNTNQNQGNFQRQNNQQQSNNINQSQNAPVDNSFPNYEQPYTELHTQDDVPF